ncbi:MAG: BamA/TamA family outer membrane protein [bacterium]|nr:BamA/TamA family outer membrane protein [bacterium]
MKLQLLKIFGVFLLTAFGSLLSILELTPSCVAAEEPREELSQIDLEPFRGQMIVEIRLAGNHVTKDWVIAREVWSAEGTVVDPEVIEEDITRLENLAIFGEVIVTPVVVEGGVTLNYSFTEMPWIIPYPAMTYTEENGFSVGVGVASPNFAGRDIMLSGAAVFGGATTYKISASNPWITGNHVSAGVLAFHQTRRNELLEFDQTSDMVNLNTGKYIGENGRLKIYGGYYGVGSDQPNITLDSDNFDELWFGAISLGYDGRDSWRSPHEGWHNESSLLYIGGDANTWTWGFDVRRYQPMGERHTIATGPFLGLQSGTVGEDVPYYLQYFIGGANSVRGYELEDLGKEIFGKNQFLYTLEYRFLAIPTRPVKIFKWTFSLGLELAAFGDVGVAWSDPHDFNTDRSRSGGGVGVRLLVPGLDSLRFDVARSEDGNTVFNFGLRAIFDERKKRVR